MNIDLNIKIVSRPTNQFIIVATGSIISHFSLTKSMNPISFEINIAVSKIKKNKHHFIKVVNFSELRLAKPADILFFFLAFDLLFEL